jgi:hypothetical protein
MEHWQNRIIGLEQMTVSDLLAHPFNARRHPAAQRDALRASLNALGIVAPPIMNRRTQHLLDGHARVEEYLTRDDSMTIDVLVVDIDEAQEATFLAVYDPITAMAAYDRDVLDTLLHQAQTDEPALQKLLTEIAEREGITPPDVQSLPASSQPRLDEKKKICCPECGHEFTP